MSESVESLNRTVMAALVKKYGSESAAREAFRTLDGGELMKIKKDMGFKSGGSVKKRKGVK
jgi:hypothetical protein